MYTDRENTFSADQVVTATAVSTDSVLIANRNIGRGGPSRIYAQVSNPAGVTAAGAATVTFEVITADDGALTTNVTSLYTTGPIGKAALTPGARPLDIVTPNTSQPYIGVRYTVATGPLTAGTFDSGIVETTENPTNTRPPYFTGL